MSAGRRAALLLATVMLGACSSGGGHGRAATATTTTRAVRTAPAVAASSAGCRSGPAAHPGTTEQTLESDGVERHYLLDVPAGYDGTRPYAVLFGLHALTVDYRFVPSMTGFADAGKYRFIGVAPSGLLDSATPYWDAAPTAHNYDVDFIAHLLDHLEATLCVDPARVFSTGMSNGAQMSSLLACRLSTRVAAIAAVSGEEFLAPCTGRPVPIMAFHGTADPILPYGGGGLNATRIADLYHYNGHLPAGLPAPMGIDASMQRWAAHNGCRPRYTETRVAPHVIERRWPSCRAETVLYVIEGGGHSWPGQPEPQFEKTFGPGTTEIDATNLMFRMFFGRPT